MTIKAAFCCASSLLALELSRAGADADIDSRTKVLAGEGGVVRFRGFKGRYRLSWKNANDKDATTTVTLRD